jgi:hypothetical protein
MKKNNVVESPAINRIKILQNSEKKGWKGIQVTENTRPGAWGGLGK